MPPGQLPEYMPIDMPPIVCWSMNNDGHDSVSVINDAYNEIISWRKNTFLVPYGKTGRDFIDQLTKHINDWNNGTIMQHIALKAAIVLLALALQNPAKNRRQKNISNVSKNGWSNGKMVKLNAWCMRGGRFKGACKMQRDTMRQIKLKYSLSL